MKFHLGYVLGLFAIGLAAAAGYISVIGWGKLFAGEATIVMVVMTVIEAAKVVTTIYLHRYGKRTKFLLKTYLTIGVVATMFLTSVGIYGFLTNAYQETANKMEIYDGQVAILDGKKDIFQQKIDDNKEVIGNKNDRSQKLSDLRTVQEDRLQKLIEDEHWSNVRKTRKAIEESNREIQKLTQDIDTIVAKNSELQDSVSVYQIKILKAQSGNDVAAEIGPLKYISSLTGRPMDSIINWIVMVIIFIFDPMAISLVLATNRVFDLNKREDDGTNDAPSDGANDTPNDPEPDKGPSDMAKDAEREWKRDITSEIIEAIEEDMVIDIAEPEPTEGTDEEIEEGDDSPIEDELVPDEKQVGYEGIPKTEEIAEALEDFVNKQVDVDPEIGEAMNEFGKTIGVEPTKNRFETIVEDKAPEEQIEENKEKLKETIEKFEEVKKNPKQAPVITTGKVDREDIKEIKQGTRGYSVPVPEPSNQITRVGSNKEVRSDKPNKFVFKRKSK